MPFESKYGFNYPSEAARMVKEKSEGLLEREAREQALGVTQRRLAVIKPQVKGVLDDWNQARKSSSDLRDLKVEIKVGDPNRLGCADVHVEVIGSKLGFQVIRPVASEYLREGYELTPQERHAISQLQNVIEEMSDTDFKVLTGVSGDVTRDTVIGSSVSFFRPGF